MTMFSRAGSITPRESVSLLPAYAAGKPPQAAEGLTPYKLSSNENPLGPVPEVAQAMAAVDTLHRYPHPNAENLRAGLAKLLDVPVEDIVAGTGSLGALTQIINAFAGSNSDGSQDEVIYAWRSFEAYPIVVRTAGAKDVTVPVLEDGRHDLEAMLAAITEKTKVLMLCTPNNPTGPSMSTEQVEDFLARVPEDVVVAIDEAYREFHDPATVLGTAGIFRRHGNVVLLRTFSKLQGLAGLRIGYAVAHPRLARALGQVTVPFGAGAPAQAAALASLAPEAAEELERRAEQIRSERSRVMAGLREQGWELPAGQGNFVYFPLGERSGEFAEFADARGLVLRAYGTDGVRATIAEEEANDRLLAIAGEWIAG